MQNATFIGCREDFCLFLVLVCLGGSRTHLRYGTAQTENGIMYYVH